MPFLPRSSAPDASAKPKWLLSWWLLLALLLVQRTLFTPDLWWHLSRGHAVISGVFSPSRALLTLDSANDADWLSGVPWYLAWTLGGNDALAAIPLASAVALLLLMYGRLGSEPWYLILLPLSLVCLREGLQPVPAWFDLLGMIALWWVLAAEMTARQRRVAIFLTLIAWANLGPRPVWGLLLLLFYENRQREIVPADRAAGGHHKRETTPLSAGGARFPVFVMFAIAFVGGMITPRGIWTWRDSVLLSAPSVFEDLAVYGESDWRSSFMQTAWDRSEWAFLLLWSGWCIQHVAEGRRFLQQPVENARRLTIPSVISLSLPFLATLLCRRNLPLCGLWIALDMFGNHRRPFVDATASNAKRTRAVAAAVLVLVALDAWGLGPGPCRRLGWGISQALNPELLDQRFLSASAERAVGWAPDGRSVGIVTWLNGGVTMADHPERALLGGRIAQHAALIQDFTGSHRARYRRDDGTWGGWVRQLDEWKVRRLFVPAEQLPFNRALLTTTWQPVDLDSPSIPFVSPLDPQFSEVVLETLQQRAFVEVGPWQPTAEIYSGGGWRFDLVELMGGGPDPAPAILQSQLFRSLDIPMASLRALLPVRQQTQHGPLAVEFRACQRDLAYQEWASFGEASEWRRRVVHAWTTSSAADHESPWLKLSAGAVNNEAWQPAMEAYEKGDLVAAIQALPGQSPQQRYARGMLSLELGNSGAALAEFQSLLDAPSEPGLRVAAKYWVEQLTPFIER